MFQFSDNDYAQLINYNSHLTGMPHGIMPGL
jgi:hypothetical protein